MKINILFFSLVLSSFALNADPICKIAHERLRAKFFSEDPSIKRLFYQRGTLDHSRIKTNAQYWSIFEDQPITINSIDKSGPKPILRYSYASTKNNVVRGTVELVPENDFFVLPAKSHSAQDKNTKPPNLLGKIALSALVTKPDNIPRVMALEAISKLLTVSSSGNAGGPLAKSRNKSDPGSMRKGVTIATKNLISGNIAEVDTFLETFYQETGLNPYIVGTYQSKTITANFINTPLQNLPASTVTYFKLFDKEWRDIIGMPTGKVNRGVDAAMAHYSWLAAKDKFKDTLPQTSSAKELDAALKLRYPGKKIIYVIPPHNDTRSAPRLYNEMKNQGLKSLLWIPLNHPNKKKYWIKILPCLTPSMLIEM